MNKINVIDEAYHFIINNLDNIILVFLFMLIGFIYAVLNNITFNNNKSDTKKTTKIITYETFENANTDKTDVPNSDKCTTLHGKSHELEEYCASLHPKLCKQKSCCILGKEVGVENTKCVAGSNTGPTYHTDDDGIDINFDYYYYQGKCYGDSCPEE